MSGWIAHPGPTLFKRPHESAFPADPSKNSTSAFDFVPTSKKQRSDSLEADSADEAEGWSDWGGPESDRDDGNADTASEEELEDDSYAFNNDEDENQGWFVHPEPVQEDGVDEDVEMVSDEKDDSSVSGDDERVSGDDEGAYDDDIEMASATSASGVSSSSAESSGDDEEDETPTVRKMVRSLISVRYFHSLHFLRKSATALS